MKNFILGAIFCTLFFINLNAKVILQDDEILSDQVKSKIEILGNELYQKTGIFVGLVVTKDLNGKKMDDFALNFIKQLKSPYAIILLTQKEHKVKIYESKDIANFFDKDQILSPLPNKGTIIPLLVSRKGKDIYNAALLNGYADLVEQIAASKGLELENAIGNSNKNFINLIRFLIYGSIILVIFVTIYRKIKDKNGKK